VREDNLLNGFALARATSERSENIPRATLTNGLKSTSGGSASVPDVRFYAARRPLGSFWHDGS